MIPTLALAATLLADPLDHVCQEPIFRNGDVVGMRVVDCEEPPARIQYTSATRYMGVSPRFVSCTNEDNTRLIPCDPMLTSDSCDLGEVLAAARAVEPLLHLSDEVPDEIPGSVYVTGQSSRLREVADRLDREDAAIARLRAALARCPEPQPGDDGDQKNPPQRRVRP